MSLPLNFGYNLLVVTYSLLIVLYYYSFFTRFLVYDRVSEFFELGSVFHML